MEVDEAASHIKELVDADANIIWGSAFNNGLEGKIRVSVVATGIEAEGAALPGSQQSGAAKVFSFPPRGAASVTVSPAAPEPSLDQRDDEAGDSDDLLELTSDDEAEELVLDNDDILTQPVASAPVPPPADDETTEAQSDDDRPKLATGGGTLFERMSNIARGAAQAESDGGEPMPSFRREPLDIPRFLNRQNNQ